jgi:hypothetical protein
LRLTACRGYCRADAKYRHARNYECDQPLEHQHCSMRSFDEKSALLRPLLPPTTGMMFGAAR